MNEEKKEWVTLSELFEHVSNLRAQLGLKPLKRAMSMGNTLDIKKVPFKVYGKRNKLYHLESALNALTRRVETKQPWNRPGTQRELESREFMSLDNAVHAFRCARSRFVSSIHALDLLAWRHPHTNRVWVNIEQAHQIAYYRSRGFIRRHLPRHEAEAIFATRPYLETVVYGAAGAWSYKRYFVPELSHLGTKTTEYRQK